MIETKPDSLEQQAKNPLEKASPKTLDEQAKTYTVKDLCLYLKFATIIS